MPINKYDQFAQFSPLDPNAIAHAMEYSEKKKDDASKTIDELAGAVAGINAAPGNELWASHVTSQYNNKAQEIAANFDKVPIQQSISEARRLKSHLLANPEVKTILNNKEYYDKVIAPYMANKESQLNVPGGTMQNYLEATPEGGFKFKQNNASYAGTLSYQPFSDVMDWADKQFKQAEYRLADDYTKKGLNIQKDPNSDLLYYTTGNERHYLRNEETFKPIINSTADILMSQQNPESRFLKADTEWRHGDKAFTKDNVIKLISPLTTKYLGEKVEGQENISLLPGQTEGSKSKKTSELPPPAEHATTGSYPGIIYAEDEAPTYTGLVNEHIKEVNQFTKPNSPEQQTYLTKYNLKGYQITPYEDAATGDHGVRIKDKDKKLQEIATTYGENSTQYASAKSKFDWAESQMSLDYRKNLQNQELADKIVNKSKEQFLSLLDPERRELFTNVENDNINNNVKAKAIVTINNLDNSILDKALKDSGEVGDINDFEHNQEFYSDTQRTRQKEIFKKELNQGKISPIVKEKLYENYRIPTEEYQQYLNNNFDTFYKATQLKNYEEVTFKMPDTPEKDVSDMSRYETILNNKFGVTRDVSKGKITFSKGDFNNLRNIDYQDPATGKKLTPEELFGKNGNDLKNTSGGGFIYDDEDGWYYTVNYTSNKGEAKTYFAKVKGMDKEIWNKLGKSASSGDYSGIASGVKALIGKTGYITTQDPKVKSFFENMGLTTDVLIRREGEDPNSDNYQLTIKDPVKLTDSKPEYKSYNNIGMADVISYLGGYAAISKIYNSQVTEKK